MWYYNIWDMLKFPHCHPFCFVVFPSWLVGNETFSKEA
uniref:Uncharacterized protein n=1 Tax=Rhizophora mucronata TaxID=61149 RepID=A0A2P2QGT1_RHIMU